MPLISPLMPVTQYYCCVANCRNMDKSCFTFSASTVLVLYQMGHVDNFTEANPACIVQRMHSGSSEMRGPNSGHLGWKAPCGLQGCNNRSAPFLDRMS